MRGLVTSDHCLPFQDSIRGSSVEVVGELPAPTKPTVTQKRVDTHETPTKDDAGADVAGPCTVDHARPFQDSISGSSFSPVLIEAITSPTAKQNVIDTHETLVGSPSIPAWPPGMVDQLVPSQDSMRGFARLAFELAALTPTATQKLLETQDTLPSSDTFAEVSAGATIDQGCFLACACVTARSTKQQLKTAQTASRSAQPLGWTHEPRSDRSGGFSDRWLTSEERRPLVGRYN